MVSPQDTHNLKKPLPRESELNMRYRNNTWLTLALLATLGCATAIAADKAAVDKAFETLKTYNWGADRNLLSPIDDAVIATRGDAAARKDLETRLAAVLTTDASRDAKDFVCRKLMVIGTAESAPALGGLLTDKDCSHMARYALERMPAPEAAQALRDALPKVSGATKIGVIGSLGVRRDAASVPALAGLLGEADQKVACAAAYSLGMIGGLDAAQALSDAVKTAPEGTKEALANGLLICAERLLADGNKAKAALVYKTLLGRGEPKHLCLAAMRGLVAVTDPASEDRIRIILALLANNDHDMRAMGFQQVREAAKGPAATKTFVERLAKLPADGQVGLLDALADRGDKTARDAALNMLASPAVEVRAAAIRSLGSLGETADVSRLIQTLGAASDQERGAAEVALTRLQGPDVNATIVAEMKPSQPKLRVQLLEVLVARRALDVTGAMLAAAEDKNGDVRAAALAALGKLAGPELAANMVDTVLKAPAGPQRETAEKTVMFVCNRIGEADKRADPVLGVFEHRDDADKTALLPLIGRLGGSAALKVVEAAIGDANPARREAGIRALCNWPDASVAAKLTELAEKAADAGQRAAALRALMRVAALPDKRSEAERLDLLKKAMSLATTEQERNYAIRRAKAIRSIDSLHFVLPYLEKPEYAQETCATIVELAHHRKLREPNKVEFDKALDAVIRLSKDPGLLDRAKRYKKGQT
jgi:HEAT repeat protein